MIALVLLTSLAAAQTPPPTHQGALWLGVQGELEVTEAVQLALSEEVRQEVANLGATEVLTEASARVDLSRGAALQGSYRLGLLPTAPLLVEHRLTADLRLDHRAGDIKLKARQRYQVGFGQVTTHLLRTRLGAEARLEHVRPYLSVEPWVRLAGGVRLHKVRLTVGVKVPTAAIELRPFALFEPQLDGDWLVAGGLRGTLGTKLRGVE